MVYLLAKSPELCLLLDQRGDPAIVSEFVREEWTLLQEVLLPSELQHILWLWRHLNNEIEIKEQQQQSSSSSTTTTTNNNNNNENNSEKGNDSSVVVDMHMNSISLTRTPLTSAVAELTVRDVVQYLRDKEHYSHTQRVNNNKNSHINNNNNNNNNINGNIHTVGEERKSLQCKTVEELWIVKRLAKLVRRAVTLQTQYVLPLPHTSNHNNNNNNNNMNSNNNMNNNSNKKKEKEETDSDNDIVSDPQEFRHVCSVLVPLRICRHISGLSLRQVIALCKTKEEYLETTTISSSIVLNKSEKSEKKRVKCKNSTLALIINPAVPIRNNPQRIEKNKRLDKIQHAVLSQCYETMTRMGRTGKNNNHINNSNNNNNNTSHVFSTYRQHQQEQEAAAESFASFLRDISIGFDMQLMALSGGAVGYYLAHLHGMPTGMCIVFAAVGLVLMLFVDAVLFLLRMGKVDAQTRKEKMKRRKLYTGGIQRRKEKEKKEKEEKKEELVRSKSDVKKEKEEEENNDNNDDVDLYMKKNA